MSQISDIAYIAASRSTTIAEAGDLFFAIICALDWDIEGVGNPADAAAYLEMQGVKI